MSLLLLEAGSICGKKCVSTRPNKFDRATQHGKSAALHVTRCGVLMHVRGGLTYRTGIDGVQCTPYVHKEC